MIYNFSDMLGMTIISINGEAGDEVMTFTSNEGRKFQLYHSRDCCESVRIDQIDGNFADLIGKPLLQCEEVSNADGPIPEHSDSYTWTFYKMATIGGYVTIKWIGESNGHYSESVDFEEVAK